MTDRTSIYIGQALRRLLDERPEDKELWTRSGLINTVAARYSEVCRRHMPTLTLAECPLTNGLETEHGRPERAITDPRETYLCTDDALLEDYYLECDTRERAAGLKPADMPRDHCPALRLELIQRLAERVLIEVGLELFGGTPSMALHLYGDKRQHMIDLLAGLAITAPGFRNPLTGRTV